jgi:hypothetical protein
MLQVLQIGKEYHVHNVIPIANYNRLVQIVILEWLLNRDQFLSIKLDIPNWKIQKIIWVLNRNFFTLFDSDPYQLHHLILMEFSFFYFYKQNHLIELNFIFKKLYRRTLEWHVNSYFVTLSSNKIVWLNEPSNSCTRITNDPLKLFHWIHFLQYLFLTKNFFDPFTVVSCLISNSTTFLFRLNVKLPINLGQPDSYLQSKTDYQAK